MRPEKYRFSVGAQVLVVNETGEVLLTKRADNGYWVLPGGVVDPHEEIHDAAIREVYEEVGITVNTLQFEAVYPKAKKEDIVFTFVTHDWEGVPQLSDEVVAVSWATLGTLPRHEMSQNTIGRIEHYFKHIQSKYIPQI
jgi:8-oxo-dGTP pyrophosphatase MutT (NUDIX family)